MNAVQDKIYTLIAYVLFGLVIGLLPALVRGRWAAINQSMSLIDTRLGEGVPPYFSVGIIGLITFGLPIWRYPPLIFLGFIILSFGLAFLFGGRSWSWSVLVNCLLTLLISTTIPWWSRNDGVISISFLGTIIFCGATFLLAALLFLNSKTLTLSISRPYWVLLILPASIILSFSTGALVSDGVFLMQWHHWSAYIAPAEVFLTGAVIFNDFPAQYGLGPTSLIALFCRDNCWSAMYYIVSFATISYSILMTTLCLSVTPKGFSARAAVALLSFVACFFWTAYPPNIGSVLATPSVSGLRFLPVVVLVGCLFFFQHIECSRWKINIAHFLWCMGVLWSPESAFYVTFVWWPYYLYVNSSGGTLKIQLQTLFINCIKLIGLAIFLFATFIIIFHHFYGELPSLGGYLVYLIYPPGPMPISVNGAIRYFVLVMFLGLGALILFWRQRGDCIVIRRGYLSILLCYAVFSYFLGRSHDNNLLNLSPFVLLVLFCVIFYGGTNVFSRPAIVLAASFGGWLALCGWTTFDLNLRSGKFLEFDSRSLSSSATLTNKNTANKILEIKRKGH